MSFLYLVYINDITVDIHIEVIFFAVDASLVKFGTGTKRTSRIINNDLTTLVGWVINAVRLLPLKLFTCFYTYNK